MRELLFAAAAVASLFSEVAGAVGASCEAYHDAGYQALRNARTLAPPAIGFEAQVRLQTRELACILDRDDAAETLITLMDSSTKPGQLYALTGLYLVDRNAFERLAPRFANDGSAVTFIDGDVVTERTVAELYSDIVRGDYPKQFSNYAKSIEHVSR